MKRSQGIVTGLTAAISMAAAQTSAAENGSYEMLYSFVTNFTKLEQPGRTITSGSDSGSQTILKSSGEPFSEGAHNITDCVVYAKNTDSGIDLESYCNSTFSAGDELFTMGQRKAGDLNVGGGGTGTVKILGGTGRYAGITGTCAYKTDYLGGNHVVNHNKCQWQRP